jgi:hypothetical protein
VHISPLFSSAAKLTGFSFFTFYHPFLPFLDQEMAAEQYFSTCSLLFWTILSVGARRYQTDTHLLNALAGPVMRLVWSTLADIPQNYHVVKALCLLCTWPFPTSSTSTDPTFLLCGMMMQIAMQLGLHRPSHARDFTKFRVELIESELRDKVCTWAVCNTVAQRYVVPLLRSRNDSFSLYVFSARQWEFVAESVRGLPPVMDNRHRLCTTGPCRAGNLGTTISNCCPISKSALKLRDSTTRSPRRSTAALGIRLAYRVIKNDRP